MSVDTVTAELFNPTGITSLGVLTNARNIKWQHELSKKGSASFEVPLADAGSITDRCIVKFSWRGAVRFGCRIVAEQCTLAVDGKRWIKFDNQPGLLSMLGDAVVYPEYPLTRKSAADRAFGFMSLAGSWRDPADWGAPAGYLMSAETTARVGKPEAILPYNPYWISTAGPATNVSAGAIDWFRYQFTTASDGTLSILTTADNFLTLYIDGEEQLRPDPANTHAWRDAFTVPAFLKAGTHVLAAKAENIWGGTIAGVSPIAFVLVALNLDSAGIPTGVLLKTDLTHWECYTTTGEPGWRRAQVLGKLHAEAVARSVPGPSNLTLGFDDTLDTDGQSWTDVGSYVFPIGSLPLDEVASQLCEASMDVDVDPITMTLNAWKRRGSDLSSTVTLTLGDAGGSLKQYDTTRQAAAHTAILTQLSDGQWVETLDSAGVTASGRLEVGISVGSASTLVSAAASATDLLAVYAQQQVSVTGEPSSLVGAVPYVDYGLGDTITVPGHRASGTLKGRVLSITVDGSQTPVRAWPELVLDRSV
jgi:hypothetical protein